VKGLEADGFCIFEGVLSADEVKRLKCVCEGQIAQLAGRGGVRNLLQVPEMQAFADSMAVRPLVAEALGVEAKPVRGILFDKSSDANWKVPWHQDVTIAVAGRVDAEGYGPWSSKAGVVHVQPPASVLQQMISVRIHLDDCPEENGALRVIAGSHRLGKIPEARVAEMVAQGRCEVCEVAAGGVLVMRPLLLHSSSAAVRPGRRRVIHFDYAVEKLAAGMRWATERETVTS
jgi:hypothetical protein